MLPLAGLGFALTGQPLQLAGRVLTVAGRQFEVTGHVLTCHRTRLLKVLRHTTDIERQQIVAQFATLPLLPTPPQLWRDATALGRKCREHGINCGSLDLLIATLAIHHRAELVTFDLGFSQIASVSSLNATVLEQPFS